MQITAQQLAALLGGTVEGDPEAVVTHPEGIEKAGDKALSFLADPRYEAFAYSTQASVLLVDRQFKPSQPLRPTLVRVDNVRLAVAALLERFGQAQQAEALPEGTHPLAFVHPEASVGPDTAIGAFAYVEKGARIGAGCIIYPQVYVGADARIGDHCVLFPGVRIYHGCELGPRCTLHANAVIGSDGFGFAPQADGSYRKVPQVGTVLLEADVEIGANAAIDRATMGQTIIREGAKIDNLVQIAHNVDIGAHTVIAAQTGIAGSAKVGPYCQIGGQVGMAGHISIAKGTRVQAQSGIGRHVKTEGTALYGSPAIPYNDYLRAYAVFRNLPELQKRLDELWKKQG